jgi:hypothetical protein
MLAHHSKPVAAMFLTVRERAQRYGRDWYGERGGPPAPHHPITVAAEKQARRRVGSARWMEIRELSGRLNEGLEGDLLRIWLVLEGHLHAYMLELAAEHYNLGVDTTFRGRPISGASPATAAAVRSGVKERLKYLLQALAEEIDGLP